MKNPRKYVYTTAAASMFVYSAAANLLPLCLVTLTRELSFSLTQAGVLGFVTTVEQFFVLIFSSYLAAHFGKIRLLRSGLFILAAGLVLFTLSRSFPSAVGLILLMGLGSGFLEALLTPLVEDLYPKDNGSKMNLLHSFWSIGLFCSVLIFGELLTMGLSWRVLFYSLATGVLAVGFTYPPARKVPLPPSRKDIGHIKEIVSLPGFWLVGFSLFFAGGAEGAFAFWSAGFIQLHFETLPRAGALGLSCFAAGMFLGRLLSSRIAGFLGLRNLVRISAGLGILVSLSFFLINSLPALYLFLVVMGLLIACFWPSIQSFGARILDVDPTMLMVFLSCFGVPGYSSATLLMGIIGDRAGLQTSFIIAPVYLLMVVLLMSSTFLSLKGEVKSKKRSH
ncbi:MAG: MFS transporter [Spirochaetales bacterium]|nr:MFS transporter [Spirochaetales bacterium]